MIDGALATDMEEGVRYLTEIALSSNSSGQTYRKVENVLANLSESIEQLVETMEDVHYHAFGLLHVRETTS